MGRPAGRGSRLPRLRGGGPGSKSRYCTPTDRYFVEQWSLSHVRSHRLRSHRHRRPRPCGVVVLAGLPRPDQPSRAIVNGVEVLEENRRRNSDLCPRSHQEERTQRVCAAEFCRFGLRGGRSAGAQIETGDAEKAARRLLEDEKLKIVWNLPRELRPKTPSKAFIEHVVIGAAAVPRGGTLVVDPIQGQPGLRVAASGPNSRVPPAAAELLVGSPSQPVDAHGIQPFYTGILTGSAGWRSAIAEGGQVIVTAS